MVDESRPWPIAQLSMTILCLVLGVLLVVQLRSQDAVRQTARSEDWEYVVADLIEGNARLREEIRALQAQLGQLEDVEGGGAVIQSLVDEVNRLRIANGQVVVSGQGLDVVISGPVTVLDLHDLINELRNAGAESLALNGRRIVAWSAISSDGQRVTVDGSPVEAPYRLEAIGHSQTLEVALARPGGLVDLLEQAHDGLSIELNRRDKLTLPVHSPPLGFAYARPVE
jgi:uncharacterized protein YlxW (UPF0749 family)